MHKRSKNMFEDFSLSLAWISDEFFLKSNFLTEILSKCWGVNLKLMVLIKQSFLGENPDYNLHFL